jgi:hypothetical protein
MSLSLIYGNSSPPQLLLASCINWGNYGENGEKVQMLRELGLISPRPATALSAWFMWNTRIKICDLEEEIGKQVDWEEGSSKHQNSPFRHDLLLFSHQHILLRPCFRYPAVIKNRIDLGIGKLKPIAILHNSSLHRKGLIGTMPEVT